MNSASSWGQTPSVPKGSDPITVGFASVLAFDRPFPLALTAPAGLAAEDVVRGAALEEVAAAPVAALGQLLRINVFERWIVIEGFDVLTVERDTGAR